MTNMIITLHTLFVAAMLTLTFTACGVTKQQLETKQSYIVIYKDDDVSADDVKVLSNEVELLGGELEKHLIYNPASIYRLTPSAVLKLQEKGYTVEIDGEVWLDDVTADGLIDDSVDITTSDPDALGNCVRRVTWKTTYACANKPSTPKPTARPTAKPTSGPTPTAKPRPTDKPTPRPTTKPTPPPQPPQTVPYNVVGVRAPQAWNITRGLGIRVCVTDTGNPDHPDLAPAIAAANFSSSPTVEDKHGHSTHVSGTILALDNNIGVVGVAPLAKLIIAKVLSDRGGGTWSSVAEGLRYCTAQGAHVISVSLGGSSVGSLVEAALADARRAGIIIVASAGNSNTAPPGYPGRSVYTLAITAVDSNGKKASFSSFGNAEFPVQYTAGGVGVNSTYLNGTYRRLSGTSMSCPTVSGAVALLLSAGKTLPFNFYIN